MQNAFACWLFLWVDFFVKAIQSLIFKKYCSEIAKAKLGTFSRHLFGKINTCILLVTEIQQLRNR